MTELPKDVGDARATGSARTLSLGSSYGRNQDGNDRTFREGGVLAGKYQIERVVGEGAMGVVVAARHLRLGHRVAIKYLRAGAARRPEVVDRFVQEARAGVQLDGEHVVRVIDMDGLEAGAPYIVMEYLQGADLEQVMAERKRPLEIREAVDYILQACQGLSVAHQLGIVHRDLKPANLFLTQAADGSPLIKVLDFGISKFTPPDDAGARATPQTIELMGSPTYMSPEQVQNSGTVDERTDVWSLGVTLYELLTLTPVYRDDSVFRLLNRIRLESPVSARTLRPDLPQALDEVILRCLEKDPARRIPSIPALVSALSPFAGDGSRSAAVSIARIATIDLGTRVTTSKVLPGRDEATMGTGTAGISSSIGAGSFAKRHVWLPAGLAMLLLGGLCGLRAATRTSASKGSSIAPVGLAQPLIAATETRAIAP